jgi:hypothetical protein
MHMNVWFKSSRSGPDGACVETFFDGNHIHIRHSKNPDGPRLTFTATEWSAFIAGVQEGEFDIA